MGMKPLFNVKMGLKGRFELLVKHADGTSDCYVMDNLVVNSGLDMVAAGPPNASASQPVIAGVAVGTGNTIPAATDTTLAAGVAASTNVTSHYVTVVSSAAPYVIQTTWVVDFGVGGAVGNLTELAAIPYGGTATGPIYSRALIQVGGSPAAIELVSTDQLIVTYQLQQIMTGDITGTLNVEIDGVASTVGYTIRPIGFYSSSGTPYLLGQKILAKIGGTGLSTASAFMAVTGSEQQGTKHWVTPTQSPYTSGDYATTFTYTLPANNAIDFQYACWSTNWFSFQMLLDSPVTLTADQTLSWPVTVSWADASGS